MDFSIEVWEVTPFFPTLTNKDKVFLGAGQESIWCHKQDSNTQQNSGRNFFKNY